MSENTTLRITIDRDLVLEAKIPATMTAQEFAGWTSRMNVIKSLARKDIMTVSPSGKIYHRWTSEEKAFMKKNTKMTLEEIRKALHLENLKLDTIYSARKKATS